MEQDEVKEYGMVMNEGILTLSIIGEIEGHDCLSQNAKTTKYEHILPILARAEQDEKVKGILFLMNSVGDDDYPPGSDEWHGTGNAADISAVSTDSGSNYLFRGRA